MARIGSCHSKASRERLKELVMGSGKNQFLPFESFTRRTERVSYGEWQELVLAIHGEWQELVLAIQECLETG